MDKSILLIPPQNLALAFIPVAAVVFILFKWDLNYKNIVYAVSRMLGQLLIIGYFLAYIFQSENILIIMLVLTIMVFSSSWIALRTVKTKRKALLLRTFTSIIIGGGITLIIITQGVLNLNPWYLPHYLIPLAGMIFANAMNSVSLAAERFYAEFERGQQFDEAKKIALSASLIPIVNSLFAVGLVSLPGMMTGQILSGISLFVAVRYQIMVMCMIFSSAGISTFIFLIFLKSEFDKESTQTIV
jgi:UDP-glucose/iron transport system permease protein